MDSEARIAELQPIFRDVLDQPDLNLNAESSGMNVEGWDSLSHLYIVSAIENKYRIRFALGELEDLKNVGEMAELINKKLQKRG